ncbi:MAG: insulinase family protein, partial [Gammaproteobacteria bacterium]|nr:insulinase family protein [Gammaproteobacteria bacterium]
MDYRTNMSKTESHPAFEWKSSTRVPSLNVELQEFRHIKTGATHLHISSEDDQNVFLVAFLTVPQDSTGVAHILEHTSLCGSQRFPVRDPFFMMTRRSLNTFMNAFTSSDWTAYPFASRNRKDFDNLLQVYLDAVFFPSLNELDFAQEGHRVEFATPDNSDTDLEFKGVVFNEMKGAMSSPVSSLWQSLTSKLFPTITYHHNSGGEPANIPDLTYEQLKAFHARHYHPSNAVFMTFGNIPAHEHQASFEDLALKGFERETLDLQVPDEQRYNAPQLTTDTYALDGETDTQNKTHIVLGWLLDRSTEPEAVMMAHLLSGVLLDNGASPLRHALETTDLGSAPSPLCGLSDSSREMVFACGVEGSNPEQADAVEKLILDVLQDVAQNGIDQGMVEAVLHQLEIHQREISGDGYPYGLHLMLQALDPAIHGADPAAMLNIDPILEGLRKNIQQPSFIKGLAQQLLDNPHRIRLTMSPDPELSSKRLATETRRLSEMKAAMSDTEKTQVIELAAKLAERQNSVDDPEALPKVGLEDIPADLPIPESENSQLANMPASWYSRGTNGLIYQELIIELPDLGSDLVDLLPLFCDCLTEVGSGGRDYLATQSLQSAVTGGIGARLSVRDAVDDVQQSKGDFVLSGKALARNQQALTELLYETLTDARFDELNRLRELVAQERLYQEQGITSRGHSLAMSAACSTLYPAAAISHRWNGLAGILRLKQLDDSLNEQENLEAFAAKLEALRDALLKAPRQLLLIGEKEQRSSIETALQHRWQENPQASSVKPFTPVAESGK